MLPIDLFLDSNIWLDYQFLNLCLLCIQMKLNVDGKGSVYFHKYILAY